MRNRIIRAVSLLPAVLAAAIAALSGAAPAGAGGVYTLLRGATATSGTPALIVQPVNVENSAPASQAFELLVVGTGAVGATVQIVASNDGQNWTNYGAPIAASGTGSATTIAYGAAPFAFWGATVTAISGTGAAVTVTMSGAP